MANKKMARVLAAVLTVCALLLSSQAFADATRLGVQLLATVSGRQMPELILQPQEGVKSVVVTLKRHDGRRSRVQARNIAAGTKKSLAIRQEPGRFTYDGHFTVKWANGAPSQFDMRFTLTRTAKLKLMVKAKDVDMDARTMTFRINNPANKATLEIVGQNRKTIATISKSFKGSKGNTSLTLTWKDPGAEVLYMDLKVYDVGGFWKGVRFTPFFISIPHDDVEFENGKWDIRPSEAPKLKHTLKLLRENLAKHGTLLQLKLFVAGYTDTVGSKAANQRLSFNRARSIAGWFRANGLRIPIHYQGFGEEVLAVGTPNETAEPRNRRAEYILSSQIPAKSRALPKQKWSRL